MIVQAVGQAGCLLSQDSSKLMQPIHINEISLEERLNLGLVASQESLPLRVCVKICLHIRIDLDLTYPLDLALCKGHLLYSSHLPDHTYMLLLAAHLAAFG